MDSYQCNQCETWCLVTIDPETEQEIKRVYNDEEDDDLGQIRLSQDSLAVVERLRLPGESLSACADRLVSNLAVIALDADNYEQHFGPQKKQLRK